MKHLFSGHYAIVSEGGSIIRSGTERFNFLSQQGELSIINTFLIAQATPTLYLCLLNATPVVSTTMASMSEVLAPGTNGYNRVQILSTDWSTPVLSGGNYTCSSGLKSLGPASGSNWTGITYVALVTTATGTAGQFIAAIPLAQTDSVAVGFTLTFILNSTAITG